MDVYKNETLHKSNFLSRILLSQDGEALRTPELLSSTPFFLNWHMVFRNLLWYTPRVIFSNTYWLGTDSCLPTTRKGGSAFGPACSYLFLPGAPRVWLRGDIFVL